MGQHQRQRQRPPTTPITPMILGEAVDEGLIPANPCRKLRISFDERAERPHASADEVDALAGRVRDHDALMIITAAYSGLRWGELTGLQWIRTYLDEDPRIEIDKDFGALHEIKGRLELGPPKTPASVRTVHLPAFLTTLLTQHRQRHRKERFVFTGPDDGLHRRTSAAASGCPRWPATPNRAGRPSTPRCTSTTCGTRTRPG